MPRSFMIVGRDGSKFQISIRRDDVDDPMLILSRRKTYPQYILFRDSTGGVGILMAKDDRERQTISGKCNNNPEITLITDWVHEVVKSK